MAIDYKYDETINCLMARFSGQVTVKQMTAFMQAVGADQRLKPQHLRLSDLRGMAMSSSMSDILEFARLTDELDRLLPPLRAAILVSRDLNFGQSRQYISYLKDNQDAVSVFRDPGEALAWLGLPADMGDPFTGDDWADTNVA